MKTVSFFYDDYRVVKRVLAELQAMGITAAATTLIARDADEPYRYSQVSELYREDAMLGAQLGGLSGIVVGSLAATGTLAIPGLGPIVAAGFGLSCIFSGAIGAFAGWLLGTLTFALSAKVLSTDAGTLLSVSTDDDHAAAVEATMRRAYAAAHAKRLEGFRDSSWSPHDSMAHAVAAPKGGRPSRTLTT